MTVVRHDHLTAEKANKDWWMGELIHCGGAARDPSIHNLFQIADGDSGVISWVNADLVKHILPFIRCLLHSRWTESFFTVNELPNGWH